MRASEALVVLPAGIALLANHTVMKVVARQDQAVRQIDLDVAYKAPIAPLQTHHKSAWMPQRTTAMPV